VAPQAVQAERLSLGELVFEERQRRGRADPLGVVGLVEGAAQVEGFAVEQELAVPRLDAAEAEALRPGTDRDGPEQQSELDPVERRMVRRPRRHGRHGRGAMQGWAGDRNRDLRRDGAVRPDDHALQRTFDAARQVDLERHAGHAPLSDPGPG